MVAVTGQIVWASTRPILKLMFIMGELSHPLGGWCFCVVTLSYAELAAIGVIMAKRRTLTPEGSKMIATVLIWVLYPCLLFTKIIVGLDRENLVQFGIMSIASVVMLGSGCLIGYIVLRLTNPPIGFRYGTMLAVAMGNHGDLPIAIVLTLCDLPPFNPGDATRGVAYISGFLCLTNLFFFSIGYKLFGQDFKDKALLFPEPEPSNPSRAAPAPLSDSPLTPASTIVNDGSIAPAAMAVNRATSSTGSLVKVEPSCMQESADDLKLGKVDDAPSSASTIEKGKEKEVIEKPSLTVLTVEGYQHESPGIVLVDSEKPTVVGLTVSVIPALKSLFLYPKGSIRPVPGSSEPPFLFLFEIFDFLGTAAIPFGLLNLGAALGRLNVKSLLPVRISLAIAFSRLVFFPVFGVLVVVGLTQVGVLDREDRILRFILMIEACVPTASSTVFLTQMWHPRGEADNIASVVLVQYCMAAFTMILCLTVILTLVS
ncbi:Protein M3 [Dinochytrium kinnereticum]|nr:Protein M3 [Dinochytrium kinnereticum]